MIFHHGSVALGGVALGSVALGSVGWRLCSLIAPGERKSDRSSIHRLWWWTRKFAGPRMRAGLACGETQEEHLRNLILKWSDVDDHVTGGHPTSARGHSIFEHKWQ